MNDAQRLDLELGDALRRVSAQDSLPAILAEAVDVAVELVDGCDHAGVTLLRGGPQHEVETAAANDRCALRGDELQYSLGEGPCLDAVTQKVIVEATDLRRDERWPRWTSAVLDEFAVRSMLCVRLFDHDRTVGALNLYGDQGPFSESSRAAAYVLAAHVAVTVAASRMTTTLSEAVEARTLVGQAQGMLMERFGVDGDTAFAVLKRVSQHRNIKVNVLARTLVETGELPGLS